MIKEKIKQRERARIQMEASEEFKAASETDQAELLSNFAQVTEGMKTQARAAIDEVAKERGDLLNEQADALAQIAIEEAKQSGNKEEALRLELELYDAQRKRERDALKASAVYITAGKKEREDILKNFDDITAGQKRIQEMAAKTSPFDSDTFKAAQKVAGETMGMVSQIGDMMLKQLQHDTEEAIAAIDEKLADEKEKIEEARNQALMEAGFIEAQTADDMQARIDAAKEAGDEVLQYELERKQEEMRINEEFDAKEKAAEEQAAREKLELQYKADMAAYKQKIVDTTLTIAQSIASAVSSGMQFGPAAVAMVPILTAMAAAMGGAQMAILLSNPPKKPAFADGGIVPGNPRLGDVQQILATGGEGVFTADQMEAMGMMANNGGGGQEVVQYLNIYLDGALVGKSVARFFNANGAIIEQRAIIGS
ncbi:hypothetical protein FACS1894163_02080 [Spirochaetia bacterium]|nr:hypothetical protein FACS1894163_02080 [Spirochaetia bacterium]